MIREFSPNEIAVILNALHVAAQIYASDAANADEFPNLAEQFRAQRKEACISRK